MKKLLMAVLLVAATQAQAETFTAYGYHRTSCGTWLEGSRIHQRGEISWKWLLNVAWVQGYLTAVGDQDVADLKETDHESMSAFIDKHCQDNPLDNLLGASRALVKELIKK